MFKKSHGVVAAVCSIFPSTTVIKIKLRHQAHRHVTIKESRKFISHTPDKKLINFDALLYTCVHVRTPGQDHVIK